MTARIARITARLTVATAVVAAVLTISGPAVALEAPRTLAATAAVQAGPVSTGFPIDFVGVLWDLPAGHDHGDHAPGADAHGAVRFLADGTWGPWTQLTDDGAEAEGQWASGLVAAGDAEAYQVRGVPADARRPRAVAINTTDGPRAKIGEVPAGAAGAATACRSRAEWLADESLRFDSSGNEIWPVAHFPVQVATVHHTATTNNDSDPAATVRAIYRYHAVDRGWGDIGYQQLIDETGVVYEGRWSGTASQSCASGGDGSDFGHETDDDGDLDGDGVADEMVTGAHVGGANSGNMGVALLGTFTDHKRSGAHPPAAAVDALEVVLAELGTRHGLNPQSTVDYVNPVTLESRTVETVSGHRDWGSTECPGQRLYDQLPAIRQAVADLMAAGGTGGTTEPGDTAAPTASITSPTSGTVSGTVTVQVDAADTVDSSGTLDVDVSINGGVHVDATWNDTSRRYEYRWDTTTVDDGGYAIDARARDAAGNTGNAAQVSVLVDNPDAPAAPISLSATGYKVKGVQHADLAWTAGVGSVEVWRGTTKVTTTSASSFTDGIGSKGGGSYSYQVCPTGDPRDGATCSNVSTVAF